MPDFSKRSYQKEFLDGDNIHPAELTKNLQELEFINKYLGGHRIIITGINALLDGWYKSNAPDDSLLICEIGCGGGDNLKAIEKWCSSKDITARFIGVDINKECIAYAKENCKELDAEWITSDYKTIKLNHKPDIIFSSLFCHHFTDEELDYQFQWMKQNSRVGFFVSDLHRHPLAYYSILVLTKLFSGSRLVKNDAPLSVLRGFKRKELESFRSQLYSQTIARNGNARLCIKWQWAFRWLMFFKKEQ